jgi:hypothetical protein
MERGGFGLPDTLSHFNMPSPAFEDSSRENQEKHCI